MLSDPKMVDAHPTERFREQASHVTHQKHLQMGLRKGMAILIYYVVRETKYQAVLLADDSVVGRGGKGENRLWKRVTPIVTEFAWLPPDIAESFSRTALYRETARTYHAFNIPHLGLETARFVADMRVEEPFNPLTTGERSKLFAAAQKLLMFVLHDVSAQTHSEEEVGPEATY